jgi:hypothetical protein
MSQWIWTPVLMRLNSQSMQDPTSPPGIPVMTAGLEPINKKKEVNDMTEDKLKSKQCEDIVKERKEERQHTMDKMSMDTSEAHTYDKDRADDSEKCS